MLKYSVLPTLKFDELNIKAEELQRPVRSVLGFEVLQTLQRDAIILILCKCVRMYSFGFLAVMVISHVYACCEKSLSFI
jgi:hypothetical protein